MNQPQPESPRKQRTFNLTLAAIIGQVGFLTLIIVLVAVFGGLWLDHLFQTKPMITILLVVGSIPISIYIMFAVVRAGVKRINPQDAGKKPDSPER